MLLKNEKKKIKVYRDFMSAMLEFIKRVLEHFFAKTF